MDSFDFEPKRHIPKGAIIALVGFFGVFFILFVLLVAYFSPTKEERDKASVNPRQQQIAQGISDSSTSFDQLPSISTIEDNASTIDFLYTKEYQLSRLEKQYTLAEAEVALRSLGEDFTVVKAVGSMEDGESLVTFQSPNYELTYSTTKGFVGVGYKGSVKLELLATKIFKEKQLADVENKGYHKMEQPVHGYNYFVHPKFTVGKGN